MAHDDDPTFRGRDQPNEGNARIAPPQRIVEWPYMLAGVVCFGLFLLLAPALEELPGKTGLFTLTLLPAAPVLVLWGIIHTIRNLINRRR